MKKVVLFFFPRKKKVEIQTFDLLPDGNYAFSRENDLQKSLFLRKLKKLTAFLKEKKHFVNC
jgi:hypothetical protein